MPNGGQTLLGPEDIKVETWRGVGILKTLAVELQGQNCLPTNTMSDSHACTVKFSRGHIMYDIKTD